MCSKFTLAMCILINSFILGVLAQSTSGLSKDDDDNIHIRKHQGEVESENNRAYKDSVVIISLKESLDLQILCDTIVNAIEQICQSRPKQIILEIDSPGGKAHYIERVCDTIIRLRDCSISAYICGGKHRGAFGASAAVALACDRIYMAPDTAIGASTLITAEPIYNIQDPNRSNNTLSIAWQEYLTSLAQQRGRPGLLAKAMVDKEIVVIEAIRNGTAIFIGPEQQEPNDFFLKNWSSKDSLLTLTAAEARRSLIADAIAADRAALLKKMGLGDEKVIVNDDVEQALRTFRKARLKYERLRRQLDAKIKRLELSKDLPEAMALLREVKDDYKSMLLIAKRQPDLYLDVALIEEQLDSAQKYYEKAKDMQRQLDANTPRNGKSGVKIEK